MSIVPSSFPCLIGGPYIGFYGEDFSSKSIRYKVMTVSLKNQEPTFSYSRSNQFLRETLHTVNECVFERFLFDIPLKAERSDFTYFVNQQAFKVKVPGIQEERIFDFCSCNDFQTVKEREESPEPDHMWRIYQEMLSLGLEPDLFILGGDQGYFDSVFDTLLLKEWSSLCKTDRPSALQKPFTEEMRQQVDDYYLTTYLERFSYQNDFGKMLSRVPSLQTRDDHDVYDGDGSYPSEIENCAVVQGIKAIARKYYYLFQLQTHPASIERKTEFIGTESTKVTLFGKTALLVPDTRNFRTADQIMNPSDWTSIMDFLEANQNLYDHATFVFPIPFLYTNFNQMEDMLKGLEAAFPSELINLIPFNEVKQDKFGEIDLIDDFADHWSAYSHQAETKQVLNDLIKVRSWGKSVLILSGDVHHGCETELRSKVLLPNANDPRLIKVAVSSPMVNKISAIAKLIPITFIRDQEIDALTIGRLVKIQPVLPGTTAGTTILDQQNFLRVTEVADKALKIKGLKMNWYESCGIKEQDDYAHLRQYQSFTPMYEPLVKKTERLKKSSSCLMM